MKANVQYNDYRGTTAADASELVGNIGLTPDFIAKHFEIDINPDKFWFRGISVFIYNAHINKVDVEFLFENRSNGLIVKSEHQMNLLSILELFQRFEFQIGTHLEDIKEMPIERIN